MNRCLCLAVHWDLFGSRWSPSYFTNCNEHAVEPPQVCARQSLRFTFNRIICVVMTPWLLIYFGGPLVTHFEAPMGPSAQPRLSLLHSCVANGFQIFIIFADLPNDRWTFNVRETWRCNHSPVLFLSVTSMSSTSIAFFSHSLFSSRKHPHVFFCCRKLHIMNVDSLCQLSQVVDIILEQNWK